MRKKDATDAKRAAANDKPENGNTENAKVEIDGRAVNVVPDIIAHRRNSGDNLFVLEAKKAGDDEADE